MMFSKRFVLETIERAVKTAAQTAVLTIGADQFDAIAADWQTIGALALGGFVLSVLTSVGSQPLGVDDGSPSVV